MSPLILRSLKQPNTLRTTASSAPIAMEMNTSVNNKPTMMSVTAQFSIVRLASSNDHDTKDTKPDTNRDDSFDDSDDGMSEGARAYHDMMADFSDSDTDFEDEEDEDSGEEDRHFTSSASKYFKKARGAHNSYWSDEDEEDGSCAPSRASASSHFSSTTKGGSRPSTNPFFDESAIQLSARQDAKDNAPEAVLLSSPVPFSLGSPVIPPLTGKKRKIRELEEAEGDAVCEKKMERQIKKLKAKPVKIDDDEMDCA